jgi:hypothetical protein
MQSFVRSIAVAVYIVAVAFFMNNAEAIFGKEDTVITGVAALLLFSLSALVVGGLLVGKPIFLYIDGKKKEAVHTVIASAGWLLLFFIIALVVMLIVK